MLKKDIAVGGVYLAKVSGKIVPCRVDAIHENFAMHKVSHSYHVTNLATGRKVTFRSAQKFRSVVKSDAVAQKV